MGIYDRGYYDGDAWKGEREPGRYRPGNPAYPVITAILIVNIAVFLLDMFTAQVAANGTRWMSFMLALKHGIAADGYPGPTENPLYFWQLLTYGFAHASITTNGGIMHILFNMFALFMLGRPVEQRLGRHRFLYFYLAAIVVSGLAWLVFYTASGGQATAVGASGAVAAVVILFALFYPRQTLLVFGIIPAPAWVIGVAMVLIDLTRSFSPNSHIAWQAHLGGAAFALLCYQLVFRDGARFAGWGNGAGGPRLGKWFKRRPKLRIHSGDESGETRDELSREADRILAKLHEQGDASLTRRERRLLEQYSRRVRESRDPRDQA